MRQSQSMSAQRNESGDRAHAGGNRPPCRQHCRMNECRRQKARRQKWFSSAQRITLAVCRQLNAGLLGYCFVFAQERGLRRRGPVPTETKHRTRGILEKLSLPLRLLVKSSSFPSLVLCVLCGECAFVSRRIFRLLQFCLLHPRTHAHQSGSSFDASAGRLISRTGLLQKSARKLKARRSPQRGVDVGGCRPSLDAEPDNVLPGGNR